MSKVKTKADLLRFMKNHEACKEATEWVKSRKEKTFLEIWNACPCYSWLLWMMDKQDPLLSLEWEDYVLLNKYPYPFDISWDQLFEKRLAAFKRAYRG